MVYDIDSRSAIEDVRRHDLIGELECTLADVVTAGQQYERTLREKGGDLISSRLVRALTCFLCGGGKRPLRYIVLHALYCTGSSRGKIRIQAEEVQDSKFTMHMELSASKLDKKDLFGKVNIL